MAKMLKSNLKLFLELYVAVNSIPQNIVGGDYGRKISVRKSLKKPLREYLNDEEELRKTTEEELRKITLENIEPLQKELQDIVKIKGDPEEQAKNNARRIELEEQIIAFQKDVENGKNLMGIEIEKLQKPLADEGGEVEFDEKAFAWAKKVITENSGVVFSRTNQDGITYTLDDMAERVLDLLETAIDPLEQISDEKVDNAETV